MKKLSRITITALIIMALSASVSRAQDQWAKAYGGGKMDGAFSLKETSDGSYIWAGFTASFNGSPTNDYNAWIGKIDGIGNLIWEQEYGGNKYDWLACIQEVSGGGYIAAGYTESFGSGGADAWVLKINADGSVAWEKAYGGAGSDEATHITELSGGGYMVAGRTSSFGYGLSDMWVLKLDGSGVIQWQRAYGGVDFDRACCIKETPDPGGYIMAGDTWTVVSGTTGFSDIAVIKLEGNGDIAWQKTYGDIDDDTVNDIQQTSDGGYVVAGATRSFDGISKAWVLKLTSAGDITWQKTFGDTSIAAWSYATSIMETSGGYIVGGYTYDYGAGWCDSWLLKLDSDGEITWQKTYGGSNMDRTYAVAETTAGEYIMAGTTYSFGGGESNVWMVNVDANGDIPECAIVDTSTAVAADTTIYDEDSYLGIAVTTGTTTLSAATVGTTSANVSTVCPLSGDDSDGDGIPDVVDNCPTVYNPNQEDNYPPGGNGIGDACECEGDFNCDGNVDATDVTAFLVDFGRNQYVDPCTSANPCNGDFNCDGNVDATDVIKFLEDFGRNLYNNPCPACVAGVWCSY